MSSTTAATQAIHFHWFRHGDLRLHDNPALCRAVEAASKNDVGTKGVVPIFCFDPRIFGQDATSEFGSLKCGPLRAKFLLESVINLRTNLEAHGSGLVVAHGKPEEIFPSILNSFVADGGDPSNPSSSRNTMIPRVFCQEEVASEELRVDKAVKRELKCKAGSLETIWGSTLYEPDDLPFDGNVLGMPDVFTPFRNKVEKKCIIGSPLPVPSKQNLALPFDSCKESNNGAKNALEETFRLVFTEKMEKCSLTYMPTLKELGYDDEDIEKATTHDARGVMEFKGGETAALARVKDYIWDKDRLRIYFDTRNGMLGADYSTKFSPWLAHGCLSPRFVAQECRRYEEERVTNKMDANMRELAATGFMSNRGRQNVCSFLAIDMNTDWRYGADHFEQELLDYDIYSNWGNWCSGAGMTGGRLNRFNIVKQGKDYDCEGEYVRHWVPELAKVPSQWIHEPWQMSTEQQAEYDVRLGVDYPRPLVAPTAPRSNHNGKKGGGGKQQQPDQRNKKQQPNPNRGKGQKQDMKSLKQGTFRIK
eukprot:scaffold65450_cov49-Attheya_sp.AAC.1